MIADRRDAGFGDVELEAVVDPDAEDVVDDLADAVKVRLDLRNGEVDVASGAALGVDGEKDASLENELLAVACSCELVEKSLERTTPVSDA